MDSNKKYKIKRIGKNDTVIEESNMFVPGDFIYLEENMVIPCDAILMSGNLLINE